MHDETGTLPDSALRIDARVLRHMMLETIDLLDLSSDHADEACESTDAAMALTRIDWMLMAVFNWLTCQLRTDADGSGGSIKPLTEPVSIIGIDMDAISDALRTYAQGADRLYARVQQLESLVAATVETQAQPTVQESTAQVLHIFGDPAPNASIQNAVLDSRRRLTWAFGGN